MERRAAAYARLCNAVRQGVYIGAFRPDGTSTLAANPHLKQIFAYPAEAPDADVRPFEADRFVDPQARAALLAQLATDRSITDYLLRLRRSDQTIVWVELTAHAEPDANGSLRVEALVRDVSDRKKLDEEMRDVHVQLLQAEKMAALGQTISGVAHELNNPLATILAWAERLAQKTTLDESARRGVETILSESERAARIVRHLLTFARKRETTRGMVDLNQVARGTLALRSHEQRRSNIAVIDALAAGLPMVYADSHQLQQVLLNLIINAEQAMLSAHGRGVLVVRTWHDDQRESINLEINDDGPGIRPELQSKIFDPFFTTKDLGKGTGLGLSVAYAIIQEHGGRIRVESRLGAGASFCIELPVAGAKPLEPPLSLAQLRAAIGADAGASVLVVEDETALANALTDMLGGAGYRVDRAADGEEALAKVAVRTFDLVICDLKMPKVDGKRFYRTLSETMPALAKRVIFMTGDVADTDAEQFLRESGCGWLAKPFRLAELLRTVREELG